MAEGSGVIVQIPKSENTDRHPAGTKIYVRDGHLFVQNAFSMDIAVYAPGEWIRAKYGNTTRWEQSESRAGFPPRACPRFPPTGPPVATAPI